nr:hypothetical protein [Tanacetum cinerariifolium]
GGHARRAPGCARSALRIARRRAAPGLHGHPRARPAAQDQDLYRREYPRDAAAGAGHRAFADRQGAARGRPASETLKYRKGKTRMVKVYEID